MEDLQMPRPVPCGLSIGGAIVLQLLLERPALLAGGVLIGTGARLRVLPDIIDAIETDYAHFIDMLGQFGASEKTDPARLTPIMHATASCAPAVTAGDFRACDQFDVMDRLDRIDTPVLVLCGADDRLTPPKYSAYLENHIRGSRGVIIPDAGHLVPIEQPVAVNRELTAFIAQL
jgi:pimeloyl-ACP methyl ester carboxylesterase